jgi:hypothetical protein
MKPAIDSIPRLLRRGFGLSVLFWMFGLQPATSRAQGTAFAYQGRLNTGGNSATGSYDFQFIVYDNSVGGSEQGPVLTVPAVQVSNGLFTTTLDFGAGVFTGPNRWLDISVRTNGTATFTPLVPRQQLAATPYAVMAGNLSGTISNGALPTNPNFSGTVTASSFSGGGANLTALGAGNISSGTLADGRLSANVALLNRNGQTFTGSEAFTGGIILNSASGFEQSSAGSFLIDAPFFAGGRLSVLANGNVGLGTSNPGSRLEVDGNTAVTGNLNVSGSTVANGSLSVSGSTTANGGLNVTGGTTLTGNTTVTAPWTLSFGSQTRQIVNLWGTQYGMGVQPDAMYFRSDGFFCWYKGGSHDNTAAGRPGQGGLDLMDLWPNGDLAIAGAFGNNSDRNVKEDFEPVDPREVFEKVAALPISRWCYKTTPGVQHLGPMAQDFYAAFNLGKDDRHITTVDADGVAMAAIQGLNEKFETKSENAEQRLQRLEEQNKDLKEQNKTLEERLNALEQIIQHAK